MADLQRFFDGNAHLDETQRACTETQRRRLVQIQAIDRGVATINGKQVNVNVARFKKADIETLLDDLKFVDISTVEGISNAEAAAHDYQPILDCTLFVENTAKKVRVLGRMST